MFRSRIFSSLLSIATIYTCVYLARTCVLDNPDVARSFAVWLINC